MSDKTTSFQKTFLTKFYFFGLLLLGFQTLPSLNDALTTHSFISNFISEKSEYSEVVSQSYFDAAKICHLTVTTMEAMNFEVDIPSNPFDTFDDYLVIVFYLNSMQGSTENSNYPKLSKELLTMDINFNFILEHVTELIAFEE